MFKETIFSYETVISIGSFILIASALYWKMRIDLKALDLKIIEIQCDRKERWAKYNEKQDKQDAYQSDILKGVNELKVNIKAIKTDIDWLKKQ